MAQGKHNARRSRQIGFLWRVTITFLLFCLVAAPFQFHVEWYALWTGSDSEWLSKALQSGPLYFYAVTLCIEAYFRIEHYLSDVRKDIRIFMLKMALCLPLLAFVFEYFVSEHYRSSAPLDDWVRAVQLGTAFAAFLLSTITHYVVSSTEARGIR